MFGFLKEKLKSALKHFTKEVEEETKPEVVVQPAVEEGLEEFKKQEKKEHAKKEAPEEKHVDKPAEKKHEREIKKEEHKEKHAVKGSEIKKTIDHKKHEDKHKQITEHKRHEPVECKKDVVEELSVRKKKKATVPEDILTTKQTQTVEEPAQESKGFIARMKDKFLKKEEEKTEELVDKEAKVKAREDVKEQEHVVTEKLKYIPVEEKKQAEIAQETVEEPQEEKGFFAKLAEVVTKKTLTEEKFDELFFELEMVLLENNVAVEVIDLLKQNLKEALVNQKVLRGQIEEIIEASLRKTVDEVFNVPEINLLEVIKNKKPYVIVFVGINGSGKTTTIGKIAHLLKKNGLSCCIAAADTFRAAAIQQIEEHANNVGVKLIKHDYGSDPAAVGFDAIAYAKAKNLDCVLIDTAGRLHSNKDLVREMEKIVRVTKPDLKLFVGEAITGNDCVEQARQFHEAIGIDGIILAKADVDEKGGAALSITKVTGKPILYLGVGQGYDDLERFDKEKMVARIF